MTTKKKTATGKGRDNKLKLKKETLKDLDAKGKASKVNGGDLVEYASAFMPCVPLTGACPTETCKTNFCPTHWACKS